MSLSGGNGAIFHCRTKRINTSPQAGLGRYTKGERGGNQSAARLQRGKGKRVPHLHPKGEEDRQKAKKDFGIWSGRAP